MTFTDSTRPPCFYNMCEFVFLPGVGVLSSAARMGVRHLHAPGGCGSAGGPSRSSLWLTRRGRCPPFPHVEEQPSPWAHPVCLISCPSSSAPLQWSPPSAAIRGPRCSSLGTLVAGGSSFDSRLFNSFSFLLSLPENLSRSVSETACFPIRPQWGNLTCIH